jgi:hypothetical protein
MRIIDPDGVQVHQQPEGEADYCGFGGDSCNIWGFADHGNEWPGGQPVQNGIHTLRVIVNTTDGRSETVDYQIEIQNSIAPPPSDPVSLPILIK